MHLSQARFRSKAHLKNRIRNFTLSMSVGDDLRDNLVDSVKEILIATECVVFEPSKLQLP